MRCVPKCPAHPLEKFQADTGRANQSRAHILTGLRGQGPEFQRARGQKFARHSNGQGAAQICRRVPPVRGGNRVLHVGGNLQGRGDRSTLRAHAESEIVLPPAGVGRRPSTWDTGPSSQEHVAQWGQVSLDENLC